MSGYEWHPVVKTVPDNGVTETFDLRSLISDTSGPTSVRVRYRDEGDDREDVNWSLRRVERGFRPEVTLDFEFTTIAHQNTIATIVNRLVRTDWAVYLSLDNAATYRQVRLGGKVPDPMPLRGKTVAGLEQSLTLVAVDVVDELPEMTTGVSPW